MRALTLWPEWAWACVHLDKDVENRSYDPPRYLVGTRVALHAGTHIGGSPSRRATIAGLETLADTAACSGWDIAWTLPSADEPVRMTATRDGVTRESFLTTRAFLGVFSLRKETAPSRWHAPGQVPWSLGDLRVLPRAVEGVRGFQGLWRVPPADAAAVESQLGRTPP